METSIPLNNSNSHEWECCGIFAIATVSDQTAQGSLLSHADPFRNADRNHFDQRRFKFVARFSGNIRLFIVGALMRKIKDRPFDRVPSDGLYNNFHSGPAQPRVGGSVQKPLLRRNS